MYFPLIKFHPSEQLVLGRQRRFYPAAFDNMIVHRLTCPDLNLHHLAVMLDRGVQAAGQDKARIEAYIDAAVALRSPEPHVAVGFGGADVVLNSHLITRLTHMTLEQVGYPKRSKL
jgi:hypothetical protein